MLLRVAQWKHTLEGITHLDKENTQISGVSYEGRRMGLGRQPEDLPGHGPWGRISRGVSDLKKSCNFAEGIESAEILQAVSSSEGDAFELTVSCQGG